MNTVHLVGDIGDKFGYEWSMNIANYGEIIRLIDCQTEGFKQYLINAEENNIGFVFQRAGEYINDKSELLLSLNDEDIIIAAVPLGSGGLGDIILGIILVIIGIYLPPLIPAKFAAIGAQMMATGGMLILSGITQLLAPTSETEKKEEGWLMSGTANTVTQGQPVPLCYGELLVPGVPISISYSNRPFNMAYLAYGNTTIDGELNGANYEEAQINMLSAFVSGGGSFNDNNEYYVQEQL